MFEILLNKRDALNTVGRWPPAPTHTSLSLFTLYNLFLKLLHRALADFLVISLRRKKLYNNQLFGWTQHLRLFSKLLGRGSSRPFFGVKVFSKPLFADMNPSTRQGNVQVASGDRLRHFRNFRIFCTVPPMECCHQKYKFFVTWDVYTLGQYAWPWNIRLWRCQDASKTSV